jgi:O-acetylserine/cysteine efflux transporter
MSRQHFLKAMICIVFWGGSFPVSKYLIANGFEPIFLVAMRFLLGGSLLVFFVRIPHRDFLKLLLLSLTFYSVPIVLTSVSIKYVDASLAAFTTILSVPFAWALSVVFLQEKVSKYQLLGLFISCFGVSMLASSPEFYSYLPALFALVASAFLYAVASVQIKSINLRASTITAWAYMISFPFTLLASLSLEQNHYFSKVEHSFVVWFAFAALAVCSLVAFYLWSKLLQDLEVSKIVPLTLLIPVFSLVFSYFILGEVTHIKSLMGSFIIVIGVGVQMFFSRGKLEEPLAS